jgi:hypothetical protein
MQTILTENLTASQLQRKVTSKVKNYIKENNLNVQYYFIRGNFHINNINGLYTAKTFLENVTGLEFTHFTNSIAKLNSKYY